MALYTTPLPTPPSSSDPVNFNSRADAFLAALPQFQTEMNAFAASISPIGRNMLLNSAFAVDQYSAFATNNTSDDVYFTDRWYSLTQTGQITSGYVGDPESGYVRALRLTQTQATAQRYGVAQIIHGTNCKHARNGSGTLSGRVRCSVSTPIRYAILGWTGGENAVTSDVVNSWTNGTFTAGNFFNSTTLSVLGVGSITPTANTWTQITALTASLGTTFTNLIVMLWTETAQAQNVTFDIDYVQLETGISASPLERRLYQDELPLCQATYQKRSWTGTEAIAHLSAYGTSNARGTLFAISPSMIGTPTIVTAGSLVGWNNTISGNTAVSGDTYAVSGGGNGSISLQGLTFASGIANVGDGVLLTPNGTSWTITLTAEL